jgi:hypothetical protein
MFYIFIIIELLVFCQQLIVCNTIPIQTKLNPSLDSRAQFDSHLKEAINELRTVFTTRTLKFDGMSIHSFIHFFKSLFFLILFLINSNNNNNNN